MTKEQEALLLEAKIMMMRGMPYFGTYIIGLDLIEDTKIPTAATDYRSLYYNPNFVLGGGPDGRDLRAVEEVIFILAHETLHITFKHGIRRGYRDPKLWNVACVHGDTLVTMADGALIPIRELQAGEAVWSPFGDNHVYMVTRAQKKDMMELCFSNGSKVTCTNDHLILTTDGFIEAGQIKEGTDVIVDSGVQEIRGQELPSQEHLGIGERSGMYISTNGELSSVLWPAQDKEVSVLGNSPDPTLRAICMGISRGYNRWRGNDLSGIGDSEGEAVSQAAHNYLDYFTGIGGVGGGDGSLRLSAEEQQRKMVLEGYGFRLGDRAIASWDDSVFADQEEACRIASELDFFAASDAEILCALARNESPVLRNKGFECARVTHTRAYTEDTEVYDLVTQHHCYVAGGVVVHNCDYAINLILDADKLGTFPTFHPRLDKDAVKLLDPKFQDMSAETIYDLLEKQHKKQGCGSKLEMGGVVIDLSKDDPGGTGGFMDPKSLDGSDLTDAQKEILERGIDAKTSQAAAAAKMQGKLPAGLERFLKTALKKKIDWRERLRQFTFKHIPSNLSWARSNRRYAWMDLYLPYTEKTGVGEILVIMDTSGSVSYNDPKSEGAQYFSEIKGIVEDVSPAKLHAMYCDAGVAGYDVFEQGEEPLLKPKGGGGTDFRPPFKRVDKEGLQIQCAIYLTDGYGQFPDKPPPYPVLWVITTEVIAPWGETVPLKLD